MPALSPADELALTSSQLKHLVTHLQRMQKRIDHQLASQHQSHRPHPAEGEEKATAMATLAAMDVQLRSLQKIVLRTTDQQAKQFEAEIALPGSLLADFEIDAELNYLLAEDDPAYDENSDNILATRDGWVGKSGGKSLCSLEAEVDEINYADHSHLMPSQGWYLHDLSDHDMGPGRPALSPLELLSIEKVWVNITTTRQYCLNLRTGAFEKWGGVESRG